MATFIIPVTVKDDLEKRLVKFAKKANAYNCNFSYSFGNEITVTRDVYETIEGAYGRLEKSFVGSENVFGIEITIESDIIRKDGYTIVAAIDHDDNGNIVKKIDDSYEIPVSWYKMTPYCQHCNTRHVKKHTYMIQDPAGNVIQVGRSCLKDYCGIDPVLIVAYQNITDLIENDYDIDGYDFSGSGDYAYDVCDVIAMANDIIGKYGYVKSDESNSTKSRLLDKVNRMDPTEESKKLAAAMKEYFSGKDYADLTDYQRNVKSLLAAGYTRLNAFGYLAYAPVEYKKMIEKDQRKQMQKDAAANSDYMGKVGDRISVDVKDVKLITSWETVYGFTYLYKFLTNDGNVLTWFASRSINTVTAKKITGTVKEHKDYNGEKQTILTRCKVG